ncbi:ankyrin repeat domain-containing protein [Nonomuraea sp. WAC 01424]|uniref:ankyrin repeat domain-containing protein n=1 Tax=Nonomuraea sp. WAC 01424 TaxID=2203200 RepID=UPI0021AD5353|nr:ankyrin repeat domain-containing protein [Nonomuraea sp. WAC 01424]
MLVLVFENCLWGSAVVVTKEAGWVGLGWNDWSDLGEIRARLVSGADPHADLWHQGPPLHLAAEYGSPEVIAELARRVGDVDAVHEGRSALWQAVFANRRDNALALAAAGADPWRPMTGGWSPGRLSLAGPNPGLFFPFPRDKPTLSEAENAAVLEAERLIEALGDFTYEGLGLACVAGITAAEAARRLGAAVAEGAGIDGVLDGPYPGEEVGLVGATDVPGGCVVSRRDGFEVAGADVINRLSAGTVCYALVADPTSGDRGSSSRDGVIEEWDARPGGGRVSPDSSAGEVLAAFLYQEEAVAYACAYAGLRLTDARPVLGPPDLWLRLPARWDVTG